MKTKISIWLRRIMIAVTAAGASLAVSAAAAAPETLGIDTIAALSAADLDVSSSRGNAALRRLFPKGANACGKQERLPFERTCAWFSNPDGDSIWPDLFLAIDHGRIVSIVATDVGKLDRKIWACDPGNGDGGAVTCSVQAVPPELRQRWSAAWKQYIDSVN
ncbi:hypothetical protein [Sphingomonas sanxanigenens]|uniref:Ig-like domain-containing protein n=1 Tax=Sphingomonas sanxanigenens DSM 19645 = NX02 TaxID=1123269 RepID=W0ACE2_9SPHN|nr:hypothetical protein [Sphingomonas sanxanigenens]AHE54756.1 hypothetical protein NX02_15365 [Sphingomonas sanxanigenens DSM 19645 = NX02]